jgi:hypothetical protein
MYRSVGFGHSNSIFKKPGPTAHTHMNLFFSTREPVQPEKTARFGFFATGFNGFGRYRFFYSALPFSTKRR